MHRSAMPCRMSDGLVLFGHNPALFHGLAGNTNVDLNARCVIFVGNHPNLIVLIVLDGDAFAAVNQCVVVDHAEHIVMHAAHRAANPGTPVMPVPAEQLDMGLPNHTAVIGTSHIAAAPHTFA